MNRKAKVLLCGPQLQNKHALYGGGTGGYTRNMAVYLKYFQSEDFTLVPCFQTTRNTKVPIILQFPLRLITDLYRFIFSVIKERPRIIHIMGQYRSAILREYLIVLLSRLFGKTIIYEIKAGGFIEFYTKSNAFTNYLTKYILRSSKLILVEGEIYMDFINGIAKTEKSYYFPNFVPVNEVPERIEPLFESDTLNVLFVGFCYKGKGIFELIQGLSFCAEKGANIKLTIVGEESVEFKDWLDSYSLPAGFTVARLGRLPHSDVLNQMSLNDVYFYPTNHSGEGHNNSINEAMMSFMVIVTTKKGFLESVLGDSAYFLDKVDDANIYNIVQHILNNKEEAAGKAAKAKKRLTENYTSVKQIPMLNSYYKLASAN